MHLSSLLSLSTLITFVVGFPLRTRSVAEPDIEAILSSLERVSTGIVREDAEVKLWLGDFNGAMRILDGAKWVHQDMATATDFIETLHNNTISTKGALKIAGPMSKIMKATESYTKGIVEKKAFVDSLALTEQFLSSFHDSKLAAQGLAKAITMKLPTRIAWTVAPVTDVFIVALDKASQALGAR